MIGTLVATTLALVAHDNPRRTPIVEVVERAGPAVVNIATETRSQANPFSRRSGNEFFDRFFSGQPRRDRQQSLGSGVIIDSSGLVLTNEHVISRASNVTITLEDRRTFVVDVVGADPAFDLAVLKVRNAPKDLPSVQIGTSSDLMIGETVVAIGNPFGLANSVTTGVVSALHRSIEAEDKNYEDFVQTDAAINPGNSGGALLNVEGKLIGINTAIYSSANGIGFAIPVDQAMAVVEEVLRYGEVRTGFTGLFVVPSERGGAEVAFVVPDSPAASVGLARGDVITDVGGREIKDARTYRHVERAMIPGRRARLTVRRGAAERSVELTVTELERKTAVSLGRRRLGLDVADKGDHLVVKRVAPRSHAAQVGIQPGDLLLSMGGHRLSGLKEFEALCAAVYDVEAVTVVVGRRGRAYYVHLELDPVPGTAG